MERRRIISITLIVVFLGGTLYLIYSNFIAAPKPLDVATAPIPEQAAAASTVLQVLPYGSQLNFDLVHKYNPDGRVYRYPDVNASQIGVGVGVLVKPKTTK